MFRRAVHLGLYYSTHRNNKRYCWRFVLSSIKRIRTLNLLHLGYSYQWRNYSNENKMVLDERDEEVKTINFEKQNHTNPRDMMRRSMLSEQKQKSFAFRRVQAFRSDLSTEDNHKSSDRDFYGKFAHIRKNLDYSYHCNYTENRQRLQNSIIEDMLDSAMITDIKGNVCTTPTEPWLVFTAGAMGAGKGYTIQKLVERKRFPLSGFVMVDPDEIRRIFPEYKVYVKTRPLQAGELTRKEAGLVAEILTLAALQAGKNVLVDGSLRDYGWYRSYFKSMKIEHPLLKIGILHVTAPREAVLKRASSRAKLTGRVIPNELLELAIKQVPKSVNFLAPLADYCCEVSNAPGADIKIETEGETWETFQSNWLQMCAWVPGKRNKLVNDLKQSLINEPTLATFGSIKEEQLTAPKLSYNVPRRSSLLTSFCSTASTEENYKSSNMTFYGSFAHIRKTLDYNYHSNYNKQRQWLQDSVIEDLLVGCTGCDVNGDIGDTPSRPWIIFTAGLKGARKGETMDALLDNGNLPLVGFVPIDPDLIRSNLPEFMVYLHDVTFAAAANDFTRKEVRYITEIATIAALQSGKNVIVDGTLEHADWFKDLFDFIRDEFSTYRIATLHLRAPMEIIYEQASCRAKSLGRDEIPRETMNNNNEAINRACKILRPFSDYFCELNNPFDSEIEIVTEDIDWDSFRKNWLQEISLEGKLHKK